MSRLTLSLADESATATLAAALAPLAAAGDVIALWGDLGTGKTAFARAFIRALCGAEEEVPSPTFTLVQCYDTPSATLWHFDLYRLERPEDALELGIEEAFADGISLIEWPGRLAGLLPAARLDITLSRGSSPTARTVSLEGTGGWVALIEEFSKHV